MMSGPRPRRLVLLTLLSESDLGGAAAVGGGAAGGAAVELLEGPDVWSSGVPSGSGG